MGPDVPAAPSGGGGGSRGRFVRPALEGRVEGIFFLRAFNCCTHRYLTFSGMAHQGTVQVYPGFVRKSSGKPGFTRLETTFWPFVVPHRPRPHPRTSMTNSFSWTCQESSQIPPHYRSGGLRSSKITTTELRSTDDLLLVHTVSNTCSAATATHMRLGIIHSHSESARLCTTEPGVATHGVQGVFGEPVAI